MDFSSSLTQCQTHQAILITTLKTPTLPQVINCLAIHDNLLYAASVNQVNVFDLSDYTHVATFAATSGSIKSIAFRNASVFTAHQDSKIRVWRVNPSSGTLEHCHVSTLPTVKDKLLNFIVPGSYVNVRRHVKRLWVEHWDTVSGLAVHGGLLYSASWDKSFKVWEARKKGFKCLESIRAHEDAVNTLVVSCKGIVYTGSADGVIRVWERRKVSGGGVRHCLVGTLDQGNRRKSTVNALALTGDGSTLISGGGDGSVFVWGEAEEGGGMMVFLEELVGHGGAVLCLVNMGRWMVSGSSDRTIRVWEKRRRGDFGCVMVLDGHESPVKTIVATTKGALSNDSFVICSGSLDGDIRVWDVSQLLMKNP